jgi:hypothetical protein
VQSGEYGLTIFHMMASLTEIQETSSSSLTGGPWMTCPVMNDLNTFSFWFATGKIDPWTTAGMFFRLSVTQEAYGLLKTEDTGPDPAAAAAAEEERERGIGAEATAWEGDDNEQEEEVQESVRVEGSMGSCRMEAMLRISLRYATTMSSERDRAG